MTSALAEYIHLFPLETLAPLLKGITLGLGAAIPIGPVNVEIARRALRHGVVAGAAVGLGAVTIDVIYAILSSFSFVKLLNQPAVLLPIAACGALLLGYLGIQSLRAAKAAWRIDPLAGVDVEGPAAAVASVRRSYVTGLLMTLLNPMTLIFWFTVVPAMGAGLGDASATSQATSHDLPMIITGVFIGTVGWVLSFSTLLEIANRFAGRQNERRRKWLALADAVGGVVLIAFALMAGIGFCRNVGLVL